MGATHGLAKVLGTADRLAVAEKLAEVVFLNESMYSAGFAASWEGIKLLDEGWLVCETHVCQRD